MPHKVWTCWVVVVMKPKAGLKKRHVLAASMDQKGAVMDLETIVSDGVHEFDDLEIRQAYLRML